MSKYTIFKLKFSSPLHLAKGKLDYDTADNVLHSDTLASALAVCALQLNLAEEIKEFLESFQISSAFPFYGEEYFFPKPNFLDAGKESDNRLKITDLAPEKQRKKVKKAQFIGKTYFEKILDKGTAFPENHLQGAFLSEIFEKDKDIKVYKSEVQERVQIPPIVDKDNPTKPYYVDRLYFTKNSGLYFIIKGSEESIATVEKCLRLLGDNGLGTDRNIGNGLFEFERTEIDLKTPTNAQHQTNLSLYCPENKDVLESILGEETSYTLVKRGGWIASPQNQNHMTLRKRSIFMFQEGSIFPIKDKPLKGNIVNLLPDNKKLEEMKVEIKHPIYRSGQAIFLPVNI
jgi:CRISPR-associated protein Csm4